MNKKIITFGCLAWCSISSMTKAIELKYSADFSDQVILIAEKLGFRKEIIPGDPFDRGSSRWRTVYSFGKVSSYVEPDLADFSGYKFEKSSITDINGIGVQIHRESVFLFFSYHCNGVDHVLSCAITGDDYLVKKIAKVPDGVKLISPDQFFDRLVVRKEFHDTQ